MIARPVLDGLEVATLLIANIIRHDPTFRIPPEVWNHINVRVAHEKLSDHIYAMPDVRLNPFVVLRLLALFPCARCLAAVVVDVEVQRLAHEIETVQLMEYSHMGRIPRSVEMTAVGDVVGCQEDVVICESEVDSRFGRNDYAVV